MEKNDRPHRDLVFAVTGCVLDCDTHKQMIPPLFTHQKQSVKFLEKTPIVFDMSDPGTGKTAAHVTAFANRRRKGEGKLLVAAPKSLLVNTWVNDFKTFAPDMRCIVADAANRLNAMNSKADVYIVNHDGVKALLELPKTFWKDFDSLIVDESTAYKHHTSARSKAVAKLAKNFKYRANLSATPTSNGVCDIWHQVFILDDGKRLGKSFFGFRSATCIPIQVGAVAQAVKWEPRPHAEATISAMISDVTIRHKFEDCIDIPKNHQYAVEFTLSSKHMKAYSILERESVLLLSKQKVVSAINAAVLYGKLLQCSSGAVYSETAVYSIIDKARYELVLDLAEARPHVVVFFAWAHQKECLIAEAKKRQLSYTLIDGTVNDKARQEAVKDFQAGLYRILFAHPQSAGHGLTLTRGTATIWASPTPNLEHYLQGLKRIHRIGQSKKTETIMVLAPNTLEERVYQSLVTKDARMSSLLEYLKKKAL